MIKNYIYILGITSLFLISACTKVGNDGIPAYIDIQDPTLETEPDEGSALHDISAIWVESEGENFGVLPIPTIIPALIEGNREVIINAGVDESGDFNKKEIYPFYKPYSIDVALAKLDTVSIQPIFEYKDDLTFLLNETFESSNIFAGAERTDIDDENNLEGRAAALLLDEDNAIAEATTASAIALPQNKRTYLEIHYKADNQFEMGIQSLNNSTEEFSFFFAYFEVTGDNWRKVYINLTEIILQTGGDEYNFFLSAAHSNGESTGSIYVDNIKIIYQ